MAALALRPAACVDDGFAPISSADIIAATGSGRILAVAL
jgi:hypothetical protein